MVASRNVVIFLMISSALLTIANCQPASKRRAIRSIREYDKTTPKPIVFVDCLLCWDFKAADGSIKNLCSVVSKTQSGCDRAGGIVKVKQV